MKQGGLVLFDTRDAQMQFAGGGAAPPRRTGCGVSGRHRPAAAGAHAQGPCRHRTFYILDGFVGRTETGPTYIEALPPETEPENRPARAGDGVSPVIIASNDLAAAWAGDSSARGSIRWSPAAIASARWRCAAASIS